MRVLDPLTDSRWDEKLLAHDDATVFHTAAWARVLSDSYGYSCCYLGEEAVGGFSFLLPLMDVRSLLTGKRGISLPFTDFCEPLLEGDPPASPGALDLLVDLGLRLGWRYFEVRGGAKVFGGAQPSMTVLSHSLDLAASEADLFARLKESTRRNVRKARREGVEISIGTSEELVEDFYRLNCLTRREHGLPPQPLSFFRKVHEHVLERGAGCVVLATLRGRSIGGAVYLHFGRNALYKFGASDSRFLSLRPNDLVMWEAIRRYHDRGFLRLGFGRTEWQHEGLRRYKLSWGVQEQVKPYFHYDLGAREFTRAKLRGPGASTAVFRRMPTLVSRAIGELLYRHVA